MPSPRVPRIATYRPRAFIAWLALVVAILVVLGGTAIIGGVVAARQGMQAADDTFRYAGDLTAERVERYAEAATDVVEGTAVQLQRDPGLSRDVLAESMYQRLRREEAVRALYVGYADGSILVVRREGDGFTSQWIDGDRPEAVEEYVHDRAFRVTSMREWTADYDPRERPWYLTGETAIGTRWTDPYLQYEDDLTLVSAARAVRVDGEVFAVIGADLRTAPLAGVLAGLPLGPGAEAFVLGPDRTVVAAPDSYSEQIESLKDRSGAVVTADDLGLRAPESPDGLRGDAFAGRLVLEKQLREPHGPDWILRIETDSESLSPGLGELQYTVIWITSLALLVVVVASIALLRARRPLQDLRERANTDYLTGIANRHEFHRRGRPLVLRAMDRGDLAVVVAFDLDQFKELNDAHGHGVGDRALAVVAEALEAETRADDIAARLGGDEFALVYTLRLEADVRALVDRVRESVETRLHEDVVGGHLVGVTAGFAVAPRDARDLDTLLRRADLALVQGKRVRKSRTYAAAE